MALTGIGTIICVSLFEKHTSALSFLCLKICVFTCLISNLIIELYLLLIRTHNDTCVHLKLYPCPNGVNCIFRSRYKPIIFKERYGRVMPKEEAKKLAKGLWRVSGSKLVKKGEVETSGEQNLTKIRKTETCMVCMSEFEVGMAFEPCLHSGVCCECGLLLLAPINQLKAGRKLQCLLCDSKPERVFFYKVLDGMRGDEEEKIGGDGGGTGSGKERVGGRSEGCLKERWEIEGLGFWELHEELQLTKLEFEELYLV